MTASHPKASPVHFGGLKETKNVSSPSTCESIVGSLRDREVACSASDRQGSNFKSCVWRTVSSQSSHHPQEVLLAQFSLYVHKGGLKPDSFHFIYQRATCATLRKRPNCDVLIVVPTMDTEKKATNTVDGLGADAIVVVPVYSVICI